MKEFIYLFDLFKFDEQGNVCENETFDLLRARSNFLYLVAKFNQRFLEEKGIRRPPEFFMGELAQVLLDVESGANYDNAKAKVLENCLFKNVKFESDKDMFLKLRDKVSIKKLPCAENFVNAKNNLEFGFGLTREAARCFDRIVMNVALESRNKGKTSSLYKDVITFNVLNHAASKLSTQSKDELLVG